MTESLDAEPTPLLDRREAIRRVSAWLGGAAWVGGGGLLAAVERARAAADSPAALAAAGAGSSVGVGEFTGAQIALLDEIAETILPATSTPGAKAAKTGAFMALMVTDAYSLAERRIFLDGLRDVDEATRKAYQVSFMQATPSQRLAVLTVLDRDQKRVMDELAAARAAAGSPARAAAQSPAGAAADERQGMPYFRMLKELAMLGFFTSEVGCTHVLRYVEAPGRYDPCVPYTAGDPAWALHA